MKLNLKALFCMASVAFAGCFLASCEKDDKDDNVVVIQKMNLNLTSFSFKASDNKLLRNDAVGTIVADTVFVDCPELTSLVSMTPSFAGEYYKVLYKGRQITPGVTSGDYSGSPELVLEDPKGKTRTYYLKIRIYNLIPRISIKTSAEIASRTEYVAATITVNNCPQFETISNAPGKARGRGNATFLSYPKKSYRFKLDEKASVCGMHKNRDWVLLAEYCDKSLMRTTYMNALSRAAGAEWTPASTHVDLFLNGKYNGTYLLIEQVEKAKHKVQMEDDGFFIEDDNYYSWEPFSFGTALYGRRYTFKYPDTGNGDIVKGDADYMYIRTFMNDMEAVLNSDSFKDPANGYRKYLDVPSFAKWYLVMEILGDHDPNFFYVLPTRNDKLRMYPVWDAEWTLGTASGGPNGFQLYPEKPIYTVTSEMYRNRKYFTRLFKDPYFVEQVYLEWQKMKKNLDTVRKEVADETENIKYSQQDNFTRWPELYQEPISVNIIFNPEWRWKDYSKYAADWFEDRLVWFDSYIQGLYNESRQ